MGRYRKRRKGRHIRRFLMILALLAVTGCGVLMCAGRLGFKKTASLEKGWNLILVNRDNYIPDNYEFELTELSNGEK